MSKLTQIENALRSLDGAKFQQLCDSYLHLRGYGSPQPLGRVIGKDKVAKGTPDTWIPQPNGKFLFAEHTTTSDSAALVSKLRDDLRKCADEGKTGVPIERIEAVIFCHTAVLSAGEEDGLIREAKNLGLNASFIGMGPLAHDLYQKYPGLARDFLGVEVDTGQIVHLSEFVELYARNPLATPLDTTFVFRAHELEEALRYLESGNLLILSGRAGVGKSRLALHAAQQYVLNHPDWQLNCIYNRGVDLYEDLRVHFSPPGSYLIVIDDANRLSGFDYLLQLLRDQGTERRIKLIITVRDYALSALLDATKRYPKGSALSLQPFTRDEIEGFLGREYGIRHSEFLERIWDISQGNPRLAVMAARVALNEKSLGSIQDVTVLYDEYYATIRNDLDALGDRILLKAAGILALLRVVDRTNRGEMERISATFEVLPDVFWKAVERLHEMEIVDMYEDEVVKVSDQVLATYLFYLACFREREVLSLEALIQGYFPYLRHRVIDALSPIFNVFGHEDVYLRLHPAVVSARKAASGAGDQAAMFHLMDDFWFIDSTDVLLYARDQILALDEEVRGEINLNYENPPYRTRPSVTSVLSSFRYATDDERCIALDLLLNYAVRRTSDLPHVLQALIQRYGFRHVSEREDYKVEHAVIDAIIVRLGTDALIRTILFSVAGAFLHTHIRSAESKSGGIMVLYDFELSPSATLKSLRRKIWLKVLKADQNPDFESALQLVEKYIKMRHHSSSSELLAHDAEYVLPFLTEELNTEDPRHCWVVQEYLSLLDRHSIPFPEDLRAAYRSQLYVLSEIFRRDWRSRRAMGWEEAEKHAAQRIWEHCRGFGQGDYKHFFEQCLALRESAPDDGFKIQVLVGARTALLQLAEHCPHLYCAVFEDQLQSGNPLDIVNPQLVHALMVAASTDRAFAIINDHAYIHKVMALFDFYSVLPASAIDSQHLSDVLALLESAPELELPSSISFLLRYTELMEDVISRAVEILVRRSEDGVAPIRCLQAFVASEDHLHDGEPLRNYVPIELFKRAYLILEKHRSNLDYNGAMFDYILDADQSFATEFIDWVFSSHVPTYPGELPSAHDDHRQYHFLWARQDFMSLMEDLTRRVYELERGAAVFGVSSYINVFFAVSPDEALRVTPPPAESVVIRQDEFLRDLIIRMGGDGDFMEWLFDLISILPVDRRRQHISTFVSVNSELKTFQRLRLETIGTISGSLVPVFQHCVDFLESLLPLFDRVQLLEHRQYVQRGIQNYRDRIAKEKRKDFIGL